MDAFNASQLIPPVVTEVAWNDSYILAKQLELQPDPPLTLTHKLPISKNARYWIIDLKIQQKDSVPIRKKAIRSTKKGISHFKLASIAKKVEKACTKKINKAFYM
ncbi:hypothetical protein GCM10020331_044010 [Ectobacillus funiculus]